MANLEDRVTALERTVAQLDERLTMEAGLAAGRDRDLSNLAVTVRSHTAMLQAVQERQAEHSARFDQIDARLDRMDGQLDELTVGQQTLVSMLTTLIERSEPGP